MDHKDLWRLLFCIKHVWSFLIGSRWTEKTRVLLLLRCFFKELLRYFLCNHPYYAVTPQIYFKNLCTCLLGAQAIRLQKSRRRPFGSACDHLVIQEHGNHWISDWRLTLEQSWRDQSQKHKHHQLYQWGYLSIWCCHGWASGPCMSYGWMLIL